MTWSSKKEAKVAVALAEGLADAAIRDANRRPEDPAAQALANKLTEGARQVRKAADEEVSDG